MTALPKRMKEYENCFRQYLMRKTPVIIRVDGKSFHTYVKKVKSEEKCGPFQININNWMVTTAYNTLYEMQGAKAAYIQSDEVSFLLTDFDRMETDAWFSYNVQKMASVSASLFTGYFNYFLANKLAFFDSRVFNLPKEEVINYFIWRQADWRRNSISMLTRHYYSHKEVVGKKQNEMHDMLWKKGINWVHIPNRWKNGVVIKDKQVYDDIIFKENRNIFDEYLYPNE